MKVNVIQKFRNLNPRLGIYLLILSVIMYCGLLLVPLLSFSVEIKMVLTFSLVLLGEVLFLSKFYPWFPKDAF